ncbi:UNVERIFIED_CONTAM: hypothetical protein Slati_0449900 [Sesamum latifolium]|uniref:Sialate O-acetylesterase domain-containing protein n=1 Tax=Sesamum latifolium TaxID=2727402 RepID=A0AAW2XW68_9LAMI
MSSLIWLVLLSCSTLVISTKNASDSNVSQDKSIFILAGQSNMAEEDSCPAGGMEGFLLNANQVQKSFGSMPKINGKRLDPLHRDIDYLKACGIGPGLAFANSILKKNLSIGKLALFLAPLEEHR